MRGMLVMRIQVQMGRACVVVTSRLAPSSTSAIDVRDGALHARPGARCADGRDVVRSRAG